jgi:hypothetical protein
MDTFAVITLGGERIPALGEHAWLVIIIIYMMVVVALALSNSKTKNKSTKEILSKSNSFFQTNCPCSKKRTGHCAWPGGSFFEVIVLAIILLFIGLASF